MSFEAKLTFRCESDVGVQREENQDSCGFFSPQESGAGWLFVVADGMGGAAGGATASRMAVDTIARVYREHAAPNTIFDAIQSGIEAANAAIHSRAQADPDLKGMGTTANVLVIKDNVVYTAHVGDSRTYRFRSGRLECLTRDHTQVQELVDQGIINPGKAKHHPQGHIISRNLGGRPQVTVDIPHDGPFPIRDGDVFLVCSDGLYGMVSDHAIAELLAAAPPEHATPALINLANRRGGADNITVCVVSAGSPLPAWSAFKPSDLDPLLDLLQDHRSTDTATFNVQVRDALEPSDFETSRLKAIARPDAAPAPAPTAPAPAPAPAAPPMMGAAAPRTPSDAHPAPAPRRSPVLIIVLILGVIALLVVAAALAFFLLIPMSASPGAESGHAQRDAPATAAAARESSAGARAADEADDDAQANNGDDRRGARKRRRAKTPPALPPCDGLSQDLPPEAIQPYEIILDQPAANASLLVTVQSGDDEAITTRCSLRSGDTVRLPRRQDMIAFHAVLPNAAEIACKPTFEGAQTTTHVRLRCTLPAEDLSRQLNP